MKELIERFDTTDIHAHIEAVESVVKLGDSAIPFLLEATRSPSPNIRAGSTFALERLRRKDQVIIDTMLALLNDPDNRVVVGAVSALRFLEARETILDVLKMLKHPDRSVQIVTIGALGQLKANEAIEILLEYTYHEDWEYRQGAVMSLAEIGIETETQRILERFRQMLKDKNKEVKSAVSQYIGVLEKFSKIASEQNYKPYNYDYSQAPTDNIEADLQSESSSKRIEAIKTIAARKAKNYIPQIQLLLDDENDEVVREAISVFWVLKVMAVIPKLISMAGDEERSYFVRAQAVGVLGEISDKKEIKLLISALQSPDLEPESLDIFANIQDKSAIAAILKLFRRGKITKEVLDGALEALVNQGIVTWDALEIIELVEAEDKEIRNFVASLLLAYS